MRGSLTIVREREREGGAKVFAFSGNIVCQEKEDLRNQNSISNHMPLPIEMTLRFVIFFYFALAC